jgi:Uncharacterized protein conserved in bacteria (DUF2330)
MIVRLMKLLPLAGVCLLAYLASIPADACCPAGPMGKPVVNADQTVVILWDATNKTQHFIRQASFKSDADDFGFLVPSPTQPELEESGNDAFTTLRKLTEPEIKRLPRPRNTEKKDDDKSPPKSKDFVKVLEQKLVAGFNAAVLETNSTAALVKWLKDNGYAFSPEVEAWAKPYVEQGWKITALKVAKDANSKNNKTVASAALRLSFKTDRPLFPYREPDYKGTANALGAKQRLLRIYFVAEVRYEGTLTEKQRWTGEVAWAGKLSAADRKKLLEQFKLPAKTGPANWYLTEFEDNWPYKVAPADVYFARSANQKDVRRDPIIEYVSGPRPNEFPLVAIVAFVGVTAMIGVPAWRRRRT